MALVGSQFAKVVLLDADAFLLEQASQIINSSRTGTLFWHDIWSLHPHNPVWVLLGLTKPVEGLCQESGIVYIDKSTAWRGLYAAALMNQHQPMYYTVLWGDKDTFFLGYEAMNMSYTFVPYSPLLLGKMDLDDTGIASRLLISNVLYAPRHFAGYSFVQLDMEGRAAFVHFVSGKATILKHVKKRSRLFTYVRSFDPNTHHIVSVGAGMYDVVSDSGPLKVPTYSSDEALGPFEIRIVRAYHSAVRFRKNFPGAAAALA